MENRVLFVDDQEEILFLIKRMLKEEPYECLFASSAKDALEIIKTTRLDVIVTDVLMPEMGGMELLDQVQISHPNIVRIILSGFSQIPTLLSAINRGKIFRYITKPWLVDDEAKKIIRDAIDYAVLLNEASPANQVITLDSVKSFLMDRQDKCILVENEIILYVHPSMEKLFPLGSSMNRDLADSKGFKRNALSENVNVVWGIES